MSIIYSYRWAQEIVQTFTEKYPRGLNFLRMMLEIDRKELIERLILELRLSSQFEWEASKVVIKRCGVERFRDFKHIPVAERRKYLTIVKHNALSEVRSTLNGDDLSCLDGIPLVVSRRT